MMSYFIQSSMISNFDVRLSCVSNCMLCSCISLWISCRYCNLFSAQLCNLLLLCSSPNNGGGATNVFQSNRKCMLFVEFSLYLASRFVGKFEEVGFVRFDLTKKLKGVKEFLVVTKLCQMKRLLDRLLNLVRLE